MPDPAQTEHSALRSPRVRAAGPETKEARSIRLALLRKSLLDSPNGGKSRFLADAEPVCNRLRWHLLLVNRQNSSSSTVRVRGVKLAADVDHPVRFFSRCGATATMSGLRSSHRMFFADGVPSGGRVGSLSFRNASGSHHAELNRVIHPYR